MGAGGQRDYAAFRVGCVAVSGEWQTGAVLPEYAQSANIWAVYREPLYRSMKLRVCVEFLAAWCQQRLGKPDEGYQVM